jgi:hypothetical protein
MSPAELTTYLRHRGISPDVIYKSPEAAAELSRVSFLQENWLKARHELRSYLVYVILVPVTAPTFYLLYPSTLMLVCSIGFAVIVIATCITQIARRRRAMKDYFAGIERLIQSVRDRESY